ncbi:MAG: exodeoxyribonuclease VII large subunit [Microthrixaceae bacterium]
MAAPTFTVHELIDRANAALRDSFPGEVWVEGEIHNKGRPSAAGHTYFSLVETRADPVTGRKQTATVNVALFNKARDRVNKHLRRARGQVRMDDGVRVRLRGEVSIYPGSSSFQLIMVGIDPTFTLGNLAAERAALLGRLTAEGLLGANATRPMSPLPLRITLIASRGSAAEADFLHELELSALAFAVTRVDVRVQGTEAPEEVAAALALAAAQPTDAVVIIRGGGARTDLAAFDAEAVARAIAASPHPVLTGIGHEIDTSVADEVAHRAYKTPTAVAGALIDAVLAQSAQVEDGAGRLRRSVRARLDEAENAFEDCQRRVAVSAGRAVAGADAQVSSAVPRLASAARRSLRHGEREVTLAQGRLPNLAEGALAHSSARLEALAHRAARAPDRLDLMTERLDHVEALVRAADPAVLLRRGYAMVRLAAPDGDTGTGAGPLVRSAAQATVGDALRITVADGSLGATVTDARSSPDPPQLPPAAPTKDNP